MRSSSYSIDLIRQMAECDANYIRLLKLIPKLRTYRFGSDDTGKVAEFCVSDQHNDQHRVTVEIFLIEAFKYTTTLEIIQRPGAHKWFSNPTIQVRVYHDANTAEVVAYQNHKNIQAKYRQPNPQMYQTDEKVQINRFLGEWLAHCLETGRSLKAPQIVVSA